MVFKETKKNGFGGTDYEGEERNERKLFLISNFRCFVNAVFFLLGINTG